MKLYALAMAVCAAVALAPRLSLANKDSDGGPTGGGPAQTPETWGIYPEITGVPPQYVLTNDTTLGILDRIASPGATRAQRAIIFTTLRFGDAPTETISGMLSTFCHHLQRQGVLQHTMLITTDEGTVNQLRARGMPAFLDRSFPRRSAYVTAVKPAGTFNRASAAAAAAAC